jgi:Ni,Fe-hydrogenase III component G
VSLPNSLPVSFHPAGQHRLVGTVLSADLVEVAGALFGEGMRLALVSGHDDGKSMRVTYLFTSGPPDSRVELHVPLDRSRPTVPTLATLSFPASRFERELQDLFGIVPLDHPQPRRLVLHQHWPANWHPMRHGSTEPPEMVADAGSFPFVPVEGAGVYEIPVGPVHAGLIEPGHFRFWVVGETILRMKARLWFVHKGIERLFEGKDIASGLEIAERISGDTAVGHALAYCQAVEDARHITVPYGGQILRCVLLELERLYNHVADVGALCNDVGFGLFASSSSG